MFFGALVIALVVLLFNLWLAGRLAPPPDPEKPGRLRQVADRLTEAQRQAERAARMGGGPGRPVGGPFPGRARADELAGSFDLDDIPDLVPIAKWVIAGVAIVLAIGIAGAVSGTWTTVLLWVNRVPFSPDSAVVRPGLRPRHQLLPVRPAVLPLRPVAVQRPAAGRRCWWSARGTSAQATEGGEVFITPVRVHLAVIAGLYLLSVAFGYQLDKYELVYSTAGVATGVSYTDANARFLAYDVLTILSGLAAALLVAGAFTRWMWPLGAIVIVWFSTSLVLGRLYPEAIQRLTVDPNQYAQEEPYIANNIEMTRKAFELDQWKNRDYSGTAPLTEAALRLEVDTFDERAPVGLPPARRDAGPAPDGPRVLRLRGRGHGPLHGQRRAAPGHALGP